MRIQTISAEKQITKKETNGKFTQENKIIKIKNIMDKFNSRFKMVEERFSQTEDS